MNEQKIRIFTEGKKVIAIFNDRMRLEIPWDKALAIGKAFRDAGREAEQVAYHENLSSDQALLMRAGIPLALTSNPKILKDARNICLHDSLLRKNIPSQHTTAKIFPPEVKRNAPNNS